MKRNTCIYCGKPLAEGEGKVVNPGAEWELLCCGQQCEKDMKDFAQRDARTKTPFYLILAVFVVANLFLFGYQPDTRWTYLPMMGICAAVAVHPYVFTRYNMYQRFGVRKTMKIVRIIALALLVLGAAFIALY